MLTFPSGLSINATESFNSLNGASSPPECENSSELLTTDAVVDAGGSANNANRKTPFSTQGYNFTEAYPFY